MRACDVSGVRAARYARGALTVLSLLTLGTERTAFAGQAQDQALLAQETCYRDDSGRIVRRRAPGFTPVPCPPATPANPATPNAPGAPGVQGTIPPQGPADAAFPGGRQPPSSVSPLPRPQVNDYVSSVPLPDRWRIVDELGYKNNWLDPYNRNLLKADRPLFDDWFFNLGLISDSLFEDRQVPIGVGGSSTRNPGENDVFGNDRQRFFSQNVAVELEYFKGDTVFKPPDYEFRLTPVFNYNYTSLNELEAVNVNPRAGVNRSDEFVGLQEAFFDMRVRDVSERFDFDSVRIGIQPFSTDFRGFLFQDNQLGARLFGTRDNNLVQYNLAYFRLLEKDTNSGLNDVTTALRHDDVFVFNIYRQDMPSSGFTSQLIVLYNRDREAGETHYDKNGFIVIPEALGIEQARDYDAIYLGYNGDGHFGRFNLTTSLYYVTGRENPGAFVNRETHISAYFAAAELSRDFGWCARGCRSCMRAVTATRTTIARPGSTRCSRIRSSRAETRATGYARRCRSSAAAASRSPDLTVFSTTCAPQGRGPVELHQSGRRARGHRRGFRPAADAAAVFQCERFVVRRDGSPRGCA